jgi:hypothetical protein
MAEAQQGTFAVKARSHPHMLLLLLWFLVVRGFWTCMLGHFGLVVATSCGDVMFRSDWSARQRLNVARRSSILISSG